MLAYSDSQYTAPLMHISGNQVLDCAHLKAWYKCGMVTPENSVAPDSVLAMHHYFISRQICSSSSAISWGTTRSGIVLSRCFNVRYACDNPCATSSVGITSWRFCCNSISRMPASAAILRRRASSNSTSLVFPKTAATACSLRHFATRLVSNYHSVPLSPCWTNDIPRRIQESMVIILSPEILAIWDLFIFIN